MMLKKVILKTGKSIRNILIIEQNIVFSSIKFQVYRMPLVAFYNPYTWLYSSAKITQCYYDYEVYINFILVFIGWLPILS